MPSLENIQKKLTDEFGTSVVATACGDVVTLEGELALWAQVVRAGQLVADKKSRHYIVNHIKCTEMPSQRMKLPSLSDNTLDGKAFDVVVVGGGVVGCAIARELRRYDISVLVCEKEHDLALHASGRNDGMVHPGIDLKSWQIKRAYNMRGNAMYDTICTELDVPFKRVGQYLCVNKAWSKYLLPLAKFYWRWLGIPCEYIDRDTLFQKEPHLNPDLTGALHFPCAGIVCPYSLTIAYGENAVDNGAVLCLETAVTDMSVDKGRITSVTTNRGTVTPKVVINAAGVFSDELARLAKDEFFSIHPRRGTNSILDKKMAFQVQSIASTVGTASAHATHSKGGGVVSTVDGNLLVGPDAVETFEKENFATTADSIRSVFKKQQLASPLLNSGDIISYFTGVRASTYEEDFVICYGKSTKNIIHAAGIQSPGLTAAPAIGVTVALMAVDFLAKTQTVPVNNTFDPTRKAIPRTKDLSFEERSALIAQNPDYGVIVCRCEEISRGEILDSLRRSVPCNTLDGVKKRTRPGMGRCKGGFCGGLVAGIIAEEKGIPLQEVLKGNYGSKIVFAPTKEGDING